MNVKTARTVITLLAICLVSPWALAQEQYLEGIHYERIDVPVKPDSKTLSLPSGGGGSVFLHVSTVSALILCLSSGRLTANLPTQLSIDYPPCFPAIGH